MIKLSMLNANDFVQSVTLDGESYKIHYSWNDFAGQWTVDIRTMQNIDIVRGIAVIPNFPLFLQHHRISGMPRGELMAVVADRSSAASQAIGRKDFATGKFSMIYIPEVEVNAIRSTK